MVSDQAPAREPRASPGPTKGAGGIRFLPPRGLPVPLPPCHSHPVILSEAPALSLEGKNLARRPDRTNGNSRAFPHTQRDGEGPEPRGRVSWALPLDSR